MTSTPDIGSVFDPAGVQWQAVSGSLVGARLVSAAIGLVPLAAAGVVLAVLADVVVGWWLAGAVALVGVWIAVIVPRQVHAIAYAEREDDLLIRRGVLLRSMVVVPYGRMQYVDVHAGPLDRRFGVARVQLHTAAPGTDAAIHGLPPQEAARLRDRLASRGQARLAGL